jgi:antitoxin (DNA-binding transcriptional repressor) of toxin-antitoxin stability system
MPTLTVAQTRSHLSELLKNVSTHGETYVITDGRTNNPLAQIIPIPRQPRIKIGVLQGRGSIEFIGDGKIEPEELFES